MTNNTTTTAPAQKSRLKFLLKLSAALTFLYLFRRFIMRSVVVVAIVAFGGYAMVAYKNPAPSAAELQAAQEAREKQQAADLQKCGPPRPEWQEAELRQLTICEAALKPVEITPVSSISCWGREESRVCALHQALTAARDRQEESERFERADKARHDWLAAHPGAQQTLPEPDKKLSPVKPLPTSIKPAPTPVSAPAPMPIDIHAFQSYVEPAPAPVDPSYASLSADKQKLVNQAANDFLRIYRTSGLNGVNWAITACYDRAKQLKTVRAIEYCMSMDNAAGNDAAMADRVDDLNRVVVMPAEKMGELRAVELAVLAAISKGLAK